MRLFFIHKDFFSIKSATPPGFYSYEDDMLRRKTKQKKKTSKWKLSDFLKSHRFCIFPSCSRNIFLQRRKNCSKQHKETEKIKHGASQLNKRKKERVGVFFTTVFMLDSSHLESLKPAWRRAEEDCGRREEEKVESHFVVFFLCLLLCNLSL